MLMSKRIATKRETMIHKTIDRKLKIEKHPTG
jgi:hypothetical protein